MKRMIKVLLILAATVAAVAALAITAGATELKTGIGIVEASGGLRLRSQASTSSDILSTAHNGDNVVVIRQVGDWYLVNYNLKIGYMHSDYITFKERENIELGYGSVDPYLANIRSGPSTSSGLVDQAGSGAKVFIFGFNCGWYKVKYNGQIGYIRSDLVTLLEKPYCNSGSSSSGSSYSSATGYDDSYSSGSSSSSSCLRAISVHAAMLALMLSSMPSRHGMMRVYSCAVYTVVCSSPFAPVVVRVSALMFSCSSTSHCSGLSCVTDTIGGSCAYSRFMSDSLL